MIPSGENRNAVSGPEPPLVAGVTTGTGVGLGDGLGLGDGDGVGWGVWGTGVGEGIGAWTANCTQRGWGCCSTQMMWPPADVPFLMVTSWRKFPCWSASVPPRPLPGVSMKIAIGSPGAKPLPVIVTGVPAAAAAVFSEMLPCGVGWGGGVLSVGDGLGAAITLSQTSGSAASASFISYRAEV
jgi:hypothetical protein